MGGGLPPGARQPVISTAASKIVCAKSVRRLTKQEGSIVAAGNRTAVRSHPASCVPRPVPRLSCCPTHIVMLPVFWLTALVSLIVCSKNSVNSSARDNSVRSGRKYSARVFLTFSVFESRIRGPSVSLNLAPSI